MPLYQAIVTQLGVLGFAVLTGIALWHWRANMQRSLLLRLYLNIATFVGLVTVVFGLSALLTGAFGVANLDFSYAVTPVRTSTQVEQQPFPVPTTGMSEAQAEQQRQLQEQALVRSRQGQEASDRAKRLDETNRQVGKRA